MIDNLILKNKENKLKIICVGDSVLDIYRYGDIEKISQEFPIPILHSINNEEFVYPGGCSNVAYQFEHFNSDVFLISFLDEKLEKTLLKHNINIDYCVYLKKGFIPRKIRYYNNNFPLLRHDVESANYGEEIDALLYFREEACVKFDLIINNANAVIMSDYCKGFWSHHLAQHIIKKCNEKKIITIVDPKIRPLEKWAGCKILKLNAIEAFNFTKEKDIKAQSDCLQKEVCCESVVVTNSGLGFYGKCQNEYFQYAVDKPLADVNSTVGAGDFFACMLSISLSHGLTLQDSCRIAFAGGVQYVKAKHNRPITPYEIHASFDKISAKIISIEDLLHLKNNVYGQETFVLTNGCFDAGLTVGHIECLKFAKQHGSKLIVAVNSDASVRRLKGPSRPILPLFDRMTILAALELVDYVVLFEEDTPLELIKAIKPSILVKGGDYQAENVVGYGLTKVVICPLFDCISTTDKLNKIISESSTHDRS